VALSEEARVYPVRLVIAGPPEGPSGRTVPRQGRPGAGGATAPITRITSPHGRWIELTYAHPTWVVVTQARDNLGRVV
jgi:hypothetical protein